MPFFFGDSFDCYAAVADTTAGYWDSGVLTSMTLVAGRFAGSQAIQWAGATNTLVKSSGVNGDAMHHLTFAIRQTAIISGSTLGHYVTLSDGVTAQCSLVFRSDGSMFLTSGGPSGGALATYTGAIAAQNTWYAFEVEILISNTAGYMKVRKNGATTEDFTSALNLDTQVSANAYANKITTGLQAALSAQQIDDFLWRSDVSSVSWAGDIKCQARRPVTDGVIQFSRSPSPAPITVATSSNISDVTANSRYTPFTATYTGTVGTIVVNVDTAFAGSMKLSIFSDAPLPGAVLGSATTLVNPTAGANTFTFPTPVPVTKGTVYWFGVSHDVTVILSRGSATTGRLATGVPYASFPSAGPASSGTQAVVSSTVNITPANSFEFVNETLQDGTTSYVFDSVAGHADLYNIASIPTVPVATIAVVTRGYMAKSDAGARTAGMQLKSGVTTVGSPTVTLATTFGWAWRADTLDPATGAAWTPAGVNAVQVGPLLVT